MYKFFRKISNSIFFSSLTVLIFEILIYNLGNEIFLIINTAIPPIMLFILLKTRDCIEFEEEYETISKIEFVVMGGSIIAPLAVANYDNYIYTVRFWVFVIVPAILFFSIYIVLNIIGKVYARGISHFILVGIFSLIYGYMIISQFNMNFNYSIHEKQIVIVNGKNNDTGFRGDEHYYIEVGEEEIEVSEETYKKVTKNEKIELDLNTGLFGLEWYSLKVLEEELE